MESTILRLIMPKLLLPTVLLLLIPVLIGRAEERSRTFEHRAVISEGSVSETADDPAALDRAAFGDRNAVSESPVRSSDDGFLAKGCPIDLLFAAVDSRRGSVPTVFALRLSDPAELLLLPTAEGMLGDAFAEGYSGSRGTPDSASAGRESPEIDDRAAISAGMRALTAAIEDYWGAPTEAFFALSREGLEEVFGKVGEVEAKIGGRPVRLTPAEAADLCVRQGVDFAEKKAVFSAFFRKVQSGGSLPAALATAGTLYRMTVTDASLGDFLELVANLLSMDFRHLKPHQLSPLPAF